MKNNKLEQIGLRPQKETRHLRSSSFWSVIGSIGALYLMVEGCKNQIEPTVEMAIEKLDFNVSELEKSCTNDESFYEKELGNFTLRLAMQDGEIICARLVNSTKDKQAMAVGYITNPPSIDEGNYYDFAGPVAAISQDGDCNTLVYKVKEKAENQLEICTFDGEKKGREGKIINITTNDGAPMSSVFVRNIK